MVPNWSSDPLFYLDTCPDVPSDFPNLLSLHLLMNQGMVKMITICQIPYIYRLEHSSKMLSFPTWVWWPLCQYGLLGQVQDLFHWHWNTSLCHTPYWVSCSFIKMNMGIVDYSVSPSPSYIILFQDHHFNVQNKSTSGASHCGWLGFVWYGHFWRLSSVSSLEHVVSLFPYYFYTKRTQSDSFLSLFGNCRNQKIPG